MSASERPIARLLVAYDGRPPAARALALGIELARLTGAELGIVSVVPEASWPGSAAGEQAAEEHAAELHEASRRVVTAGLLDPTLHEPVGEPGPAIVEVGREYGYDAIVIGSRHLGAVRSMLLGSVSDYVAHHAEANVIIAR